MHQTTPTLLLTFLVLGLACFSAQTHSLPPTRLLNQTLERNVFATVHRFQQPETLLRRSHIDRWLSQVQQYDALVDQMLDATTTLNAFLDEVQRRRLDSNSAHAMQNSIRANFELFQSGSFTGQAITDLLDILDNPSGSASQLRDLIERVNEYKALCRRYQSLSSRVKSNPLDQDLVQAVHSLMGQLSQ